MNQTGIFDALTIDYYNLAVIGASYFFSNKNRIVCEAFAERLPINRRFMVMSGTEYIREYLLKIRFSKDDINFLKTTDLKSVFSTTNFDKYLEDFRFRGDFWAMAEGEIVFAGEPLIRVVGTPTEICMANSISSSVLNSNINIASKTARMSLVSYGKPLLDLTRICNSSFDIARSSYLTGFSATLNSRASQIFNIPLFNFMPYYWSEINDKALEEFSIYKPSSIIINKDNIFENVKSVCQLKGLGSIIIEDNITKSECDEIRKILNDNNCSNVKIVFSGNIDEYEIDCYRNYPIDKFGIKNCISNEIKIVYKPVYDEEEKLKLSGNKTFYLGTKQVFLDIRNGCWSHLVALDGCIKPSEELMPLLDLHIKDGKKVEDCVVDLKTSRKYCKTSLSNLHYNLVSIKDRDLPSPVFPDNSLKDFFKRTLK